jgi:hypothetical protein
MRKYLEQYGRILRFLAKVQGASKNHIHEQPSIFDTYRDDMYAFFQNCWHMRDWITYDDSIPKKTSAAIRREAEHNKALLVCADMANASKHLKLIHPPRVGAEDRELRITIGPDAQVSWEYMIQMSDGTTVSAVEAAVAAVNAWTDILHRHGLRVDVEMADA